MIGNQNTVELFKIFCMNSIKAKDVDPAINYLNYMVDRMEMNDEQILYLCFLYGLTYQLPTAYVIWNEFPDLELIDEKRLTEWYIENDKKLPFQQDKLKSRVYMVDTILSYQKCVNGSQKQYFDNILNSDPQTNFDRLWTPLTSVYRFGRFSTWNQAQALKHVAKYNIEPTRLMLGEEDSATFTDGLAYAFGHPEKMTKKRRNKNGRKVKDYYEWSEEEKQEMEEVCSKLKNELNLDNFELETLACSFKKIWRKNQSRYVGYYNDRIADDIRNTESKGWAGVNFDLLWDARNCCVPKEYLHMNAGVNFSKFKLSPEAKIYS